jgi:predicted phage terminase large subunit-like protein
MSGQPLWRSRMFKAVMKWPDDMGKWGEWERIFTDQTDDSREDKARAFYEANRAAMEAGAEVLWSPRADLYMLMCKRALSGHTSFESEHQNNPIDPTKCEWQPELFDAEDMWFEEWPDDLDSLVLALDPSKGRSDKQGDYQALVAVGWKKGLLYIDADISRRPIDAMMQTFLAWGSMLRPDTAVVEADQFQEVVMGNLDEQAKNDGLPFAVGPINTEGVNKKVRIRRLSPWISQRRMRFKKRSPGVRLLLTQLQDFPLGDHDDGPDALEMAVREIMQAVHGDKGTGIQNPY